jgi:predicted outer membrane repeat protein
MLLLLCALAHAADVTVGTSGDYTSIADAVAAVTISDTIVILEDIVETVVVSGAVLSIEGYDLGGGVYPTVSFDAAISEDATFNVVSGAALTVSNLNISGRDVAQAIQVAVTATLTVESATLTDCGWGDTSLGGCMASSGDVSLSNVIIEGAEIAEGYGGGISILGGTLNMNGGHLSGGNGDRGGGIYAESGSITLDDVDMSNNHATEYGGAIFVESAAVIITAGAFTDNSSELDGNQLYISADSSLSVSQHATFDGLGRAADDSAIYIYQPETATFLDVEFIDTNLAIRSVQVDDLKVGRTLFCGGTLPAIQTTESEEVAIHNSRFLLGGTGAAAIFIDDDADTVTIHQNHFVNDEGSRAIMVSGSATPDFYNNVVVGYREGEYAVDGTDVLVHSNLYFDNDLNWNGTETASQIVGEDPLFLHDTPPANCDEYDVRGRNGSPMWWAGEGVDINGDANQIGAWGGLDADMTDADGDTWPVGFDCDDTSLAAFYINPDEPDICDDEIDQDCTGSDATDPHTWFADQDGDKLGDKDTTIESCDDERPLYVLNPSDCAPTDEDLFLSLGTEAWLDADEDGYGDPLQYDTCGSANPGNWSANADDCDDTNASIHPGATETCDDVDEDCDDAIDDGLTAYTVYADIDGDGWGFGGGWTTCDPTDGVDEAGDCSPDDASIYPTGPELCDGLDNNCTAGSDELLPTRDWYIDADNDGFGSTADIINQCSQPDGYSAYPGDCRDDIASTYPGAVEDCAGGVDEDCSGSVEPCFGDDGDGDGFCDAVQCADNSWPGDCDDNDDNVHPLASETCNGIDDDCSGAVDDLAFDVDNDGHTSTASCLGSADDCNDLAPQVNPNATEVCNGIDDNCDGVADVVTDEDGDGYITADSECPTNGLKYDCDDTDGGIYPGATEDPYNGLDDDCDSYIDEHTDNDDSDGDGYCKTLPCVDGGPSGGLGGDCDDTDAGVSPAAPEVLGDNIDNDCDGFIDETPSSVPPDYVEIDNDGDGFSQVQGDCNDVDPAVYPGAEEACNGLDDDCDNIIDVDELDIDQDGLLGCANDCDDLDPAVREGLAERCDDGKDNDCNGTIDVDEDSDLDGHTTCSGDCNDTDPEVHPGHVELCNLIDDDCDGLADEGFDLDADGYGDCSSCEEPCDCNDLMAHARPGQSELCGDGIDNDCDGTVDVAEDKDGDGISTCGGDCDDNDYNVTPRASEWCNGRDDNCDGGIDETFDLDGDGQTTCGGDCDDDDDNRMLGAPEQCDNVDNNCNQVIDDPWPDHDLDGFTVCNLDCDDSDPTVNAAAAEICDDGIDNNCNGIEDAYCVETRDTATDTDDFQSFTVPSPRCQTGGGPWWLATASLMIVISRKRRRQ